MFLPCFIDGAGIETAARCFSLLVARNESGEPLLHSPDGVFYLVSGDGLFDQAEVLALTQSREPKATDVIIEVAHRDPDAHVRGQALFWLAQSAARRAPEAIKAALDDDPELEVKKKAAKRAVTVASGLGRSEAVDLLAANWFACTSNGSSPRDAPWLR